MAGLWEKGQKVNHDENELQSGQDRHTRALSWICRLAVHFLLTVSPEPLVYGPSPKEKGKEKGSWWLIKRGGMHVFVYYITYMDIKPTWNYKKT